MAGSVSSQSAPSATYPAGATQPERIVPGSPNPSQSASRYQIKALQSPYSQVSLKKWYGRRHSTPPEITMRPRDESYAIAWRYLDAGPREKARCQLEPSHSQVSPKKSGSEEPPNSTMRLRSTSYAMAWPYLGRGPVEDLWIQTAPSHSQVSPSRWVKSRPP